MATADAILGLLAELYATSSFKDGKIAELEARVAALSNEGTAPQG